MNATQMLAHCRAVLEVTNGERSLHVPLIARLFAPIVRATVFGKAPYPKDGRTAPEFVVDSAHDFEAEKRHLLEALTTFHSMDKSKAVTIKHPLLGKMTLEQRGWSMLKHLDHHLVQFGKPSLVFGDDTV